MTEKQLARQKEKEEKARLKLEKEMARTEAMLVYERRFAHKGRIAGIDEVGRGPLAGPVVACALILPTDHNILFLNDCIIIHSIGKIQDRRRIASNLYAVGSFNKLCICTTQSPCSYSHFSSLINIFPLNRHECLDNVEPYRGIT